MYIFVCIYFTKRIYKIISLPAITDRYILLYRYTESWLLISIYIYINKNINAIGMYSEFLASIKKDPTVTSMPIAQCPCTYGMHVHKNIKSHIIYMLVYADADRILPQHGIFHLTYKKYSLKNVIQARNISYLCISNMYYNVYCISKSYTYYIHIYI